jgi:hypothetical protein
MTTDINFTRQDNKVYFKCEDKIEKEVKELKDQINCLHRSVAALRKDLPSILIRALLNVDNRRALCF